MPLCSEMGYEIRESCRSKACSSNMLRINDIGEGRAGVGAGVLGCSRMLCVLRASIPVMDGPAAGSCRSLVIEIGKML